MTKGIVLSIDQGTTGTTVLAVDDKLNVVSKANREYPQIYPHPGWVEHSAADIWRSVHDATVACVEGASIKAKDIVGIGIANQRETSSLIDRNGELLHNFIVWQCRRSADICNKLKDRGFLPKVIEKTGLVLDPYFSGTKITWLFDSFPELYKMSCNGSALFVTINSWLVYKFTGNKVHVTDATNASRTLMMNLESRTWDDEMLEMLRVPKECLPHIVSNSEVVGHTEGLSFLPDGIPIASMIGDQQSALFGLGCINAGDAKATFGTGSFILQNSGGKRVYSKNGLISSIALAGKNTTYCLERSAFIAGAAIQWLRDGLGIIKSSSEIEALARTVDGTGDVSFVPALAGLGAPHWRSDARGLFRGLTRDTNKGHLARAVLEGVALQNYDVVEAMQKDGAHLNYLKVDGGAAANNLMMQFQSDVLNLRCLRPHSLEATAMGAAKLAGMALGMFTEFPEVAIEREFKPTMMADERARALTKWRKAVDCA